MKHLSCYFLRFYTYVFILESFPCEKFRPPRGFEPTISCMPGRYFYQLNYRVLHLSLGIRHMFIDHSHDDDDIGKKNLPGMQEIVGSNPRGSRNFSHGKLSKINPLILKSHFLRSNLNLYLEPVYV